jgi:hypothetical protein
MKRLGWKTPLGIFDKKKPKVLHMQVFGCGAYIFIPKEKRKNKLSPKMELMTFIGYSQGNYLFMQHEACYTTFSSPKAIFDEMFFPFCPNNIYGRKRKALTSVTDSDNTSLQRPSTPPRPSGPSPPDDLDKESSNDRFIFPYAASDSRESSLFPWDTLDRVESPFSDLLYKDIEPEEPEEIVIREPEQQPEEVEEQPQEIYLPDTS